MGLRDLPLEEVARKCRDGSAHYVRGQRSPGDEFCYELFRRAICVPEQRDVAWSAVVAQYTSLVSAYVRRHPWAGSRRDDVDFWVNEAFERFWKAVKPERFGQFADLPSLIAYLRTCAHSAIAGDQRSDHAHQLLDELDDESLAVHDAATGVLDDVVLRELWLLVETELYDDAERTVARLSFLLDYKPSEVHELRPDLFPSVKDVYTIKRRVIERLGRRQQFKDFFE